MGCTCSAATRPSSFNGVRVVHINGHVEEFLGPVAVSDVTGKPPKMLLFSSAQLRCFGSQPLALDVDLQQGQLYFLIPYSVFQADSTPVDLAALATRLTNVAMDRHRPVNTHVVFDARNGGGSSGRVSGPFMTGFVYGGRGVGGAPAAAPAPAGRVRSWKPMLDSIEERSFGRSNQGLTNAGT